MASVNTSDCSAQDGTLSLKDMIIRQEKFAKEAFEFLLKNAHIWMEYPKHFLTSHEKLNKSVVFTDTVGKAIITIAYMLRSEYRKRFQEVGEFMRDPKMYEECLNNFEIFKDDLYFHHFLSWVAFAFDLTMHCYKEGYNHIWRGERCIANYKDVEYFNSRGGFRSLIENTVTVDLAAIHDTMKQVIGEEPPQGIMSFMKRVEHMERRYRYNNEWLRHVSEIKRKLSAKYSIAASLDPVRVIRGYKVILKKSPTSPQKVSSESKVPVSDATKLDSGKKDESSYSLNTGDSEPIFIMHKRFLDKWKESRKDSKNKRGLKICSPSKESGRLAMNLNKLLEKNIKGGHFSKIGDDIYANCPPDHSIYDLDTKVIVLDTSSEEEDCGNPEPFECLQSLSSRSQEFICTEIEKNLKERREASSIFPELKSRTLTFLTKLDSIELEFEKETAELATLLTHEQSKCTKTKSKESAEETFSEKNVVSKITGAVSNKGATSISSEKKMSTSRITEGQAKQSATEEHSGQKSFVPTESTEERTKIEKNTSKGSPEEVLPTENRSRDLEHSEQNKQHRKSNSSKKSSRKGKKLRK